MSTLDDMTRKIRENMSPMYGSPAAFWEARVKIAQRRLQVAQERAAAASTAALKAFWEGRVKSAQRKLNYLQRRAASAKAPGGLGPHEIAARWREAMMAR